MSNSPKGLICLDLDGTSLCFDGIHRWFCEDVAARLNEAVRRGVVWCTNSGRTADSQFGIIQACRELETMPVAILSGERYIHDVHSTGFVVRPWREHNELARNKAREVSPRVRDVLEPHLGELRERFDVAEWHAAEEFSAWLLTDSTDPVRFADTVRSLLETVPDAQVVRNGRWVVVIHADFGKGKLLASLAAELGVRRGRILAVGDQQNDLDMLDGRAAGYVGCPSDADDQIKSAVRAVGGWIAGSPGTAGTADLIRRFVDEVL